MDEVEDTGHEEADVKGDEQAADVEQPDQKVTQVNAKAKTLFGRTCAEGPEDKMTKTKTRNCVWGKYSPSPM